MSRSLYLTGRFRSLFQDFLPSGTWYRKEEMAGVGKGDSGGELLAKDAAKTWFSRKEKRGNTDTWSDDKRNKGERIVGEGLVHKMRRKGEQTRVWLHDALDASRPSDQTRNPFSAVNCFLDRIWPVRLSPPYLGLRCVVESEGEREHVGVTDRNAWSVSGSHAFHTWRLVVGWWYTSFLSACRNVSRVMPAGMVLAAWSMEFDVWPAKVLGSWALLYFGNFPFFFKF